MWLESTNLHIFGATHQSNQQCVFPLKLHTHTHTHVSQSQRPMTTKSELFSESYYLIDVIQVGSLIGPVVVALLRPALDKRRQHNNNHAAVLPYHLQTKHTLSEAHGGSTGRHRHHQLLTEASKVQTPCLNQELDVAYLFIKRSHSLFKCTLCNSCRERSRNQNN